jgi:hypothetical protein
MFCKAFCYTRIIFPFAHGKSNRPEGYAFRLEQGRERLCRLLLLFSRIAWAAHGKEAGGKIPARPLSYFPELVYFHLDNFYLRITGV